MAYTYDQQKRIDTANAKVASAQKARDLALSDYRARYANFCDEGWWNYLTDCDIRKVSSRWRKKAVEALTVGISLFTNNYLNKKWTKPNSCDEALEKGVLISWECNRGKGDCVRGETCNNKVAEYNAKLKSLDDSATVEANSREILANAQADLKNLLNTISGEVENDPAFQLEKDNILASIKKNRNKLIFLGFSLAVILTAIYFFRRTSTPS